MGFFLSEVHEYNLTKVYEMRIREIETFWKRIGCWLPQSSKTKR